MTEMDEQFEQDFEEWLRRGRKSFKLELIDDDHPGHEGNKKPRGRDVK